jgi:hypothetical protein
MRGNLMVMTALAAGLIVVGCDDDGGAEQAITKEEYVAKANQACAESRHRADAVFERVGFSGPPTAAEAQRVLQALVPVMRQSFEGRSAIEIPEGEEDAIGAINEAGDEALAEFERVAGDPAAAQALMTGQTPDPAIEVDRLSGEYGLDQCAGKD